MDLCGDVFFIVLLLSLCCTPGADDPDLVLKWLRKTHQKKFSCCRTTNNDLARLLRRMIGVVENPSQRIREDRGSLDERYAVFPYIRPRFETVPFKGRSQATPRITRIETIRLGGPFRIVGDSQRS